jgi:hypothetical protein
MSNPSDRARPRNGRLLLGVIPAALVDKSNVDKLAERSWRETRYLR